MAINPSTEVRLYKNIPFDKGREHTYKFESIIQQQSFFGTPAARPYYDFTNNIRIKLHEKTIRLGISYKNARECNYVAFINGTDQQENKWYYAFVDYVEYVNPNVSLIHYSLDYMQTYLFEFRVLPCLVEREHTKTDELGEHILPEGLEIGDMVVNTSLRDKTTGLPINEGGAIRMHIGDKFGYIVLTTKDVAHSILTPPANFDDFTFINNTPYPYQVIWCDNDIALKYVVDTVQSWGNNDAIIGIFSYPASLINWQQAAYWVHLVTPALNFYAYAELKDVRTAGSVGASTARICRDITNLTPVSYVTSDGGTPVVVRSAVDIPIISPSATSIDGYVPFNTKLYSSPFMFMEVTDNCGHTNILRTEFFDKTKDRITFTFNANFGMNPQIMCSPNNYRNQQIDYENAVTMQNVYESIPWTADQFKEWAVQNSGKLALAFAAGASGVISPVLAASIGVTTLSSMRTGYDYEYQVPVQNRSNGQFASGTHMETRIGRDESAIQEREINIKRKFEGESVLDSATGLVKCAGVMQDVGAHMILPPAIQGHINNGSINTSSANSNLADFFVRLYTVRADFAERIDNFFSRYGYNVNAFKIPNIFDNTNGVPRPRWNYVKTADAKVVAVDGHYFDANVEENIEAIINRGITFWNPSVTIGDYTQTTTVNNKPIV